MAAARSVAEKVPLASAAAVHAASGRSTTSLCTLLTTKAATSVARSGTPVGRGPTTGRALYTLSSAVPMAYLAVSLSVLISGVTLGRVPAAVAVGRPAPSPVPGAAVGTARLLAALPLGLVATAEVPRLPSGAVVLPVGAGAAGLGRCSTKAGSCCRMARRVSSAVRTAAVGGLTLVALLGELNPTPRAVDTAPDRRLKLPVLVLLRALTALLWPGPAATAV